MKLHIGCHKTRFNGWINSDIRKTKEVDIRLDARRYLPFKNNSIDFIFSEHFIEHLSYEEGLFFFKECYRILKEKGVIRTATLDLDFLIRKYYFNWNEQNWLTTYPEIQTAGQMLNACFYKWNHKFLYNEEDIYTLGVNFTTQYKETIYNSNYPELQNLEYRPESTLIIEGIK